MARHGENIRKRNDGRWEGRYPVYKEEKGKKVYCSVYGKSYDEVKEKLAVQKSVLKEEQTLPAPFDNRNQNITILFSEAAEKWLSEVSFKRKISTCAKYRSIYKKYLASALGKYDAAKISALLVNETVSAPLSESVQKSIYCVINQILSYSAKEYGISVQNIKRQPVKEKRKPIEVLTKIEQTRLFSVISYHMDIYKMAVVLCLYTGIRIGELCALKWSDIDFENRLISINRTVQRVAVNDRQTKTELLEIDPKSEYSKREIPISNDLMELFLKFRHGDSYIFGGNKPMEPRTLQYRFKKYLKEAGLPDKNFHILRHTFATNCIEEGTDVKCLSEILGHSDVQITLNRYVHPSMEIKRKHLDRLSQIYGQIYGQAG